MTRAQQLMDAKARLSDAKEILKNHEENGNYMDYSDFHEVLLDLQLDVHFAFEHLTKIERSQS